MNNHQLLSRVQELQRQLSAMRRVASSIENLSEDACSGIEDQWPDSLESELNLLQRMFRRFQEAELEDDLLDLLVAGRPQVAELAVDANAASKKASNGFLSAFDTINLEDCASSGFTSWHWFEHAFREFVAKNWRLLTTASDLIRLENESENSKSAGLDPAIYPSIKN